MLFLTATTKPDDVRSTTLTRYALPVQGFAVFPGRKGDETGGGLSLIHI